MMISRLALMGMLICLSLYDVHLDAGRGVFIPAAPEFSCAELAVLYGLAGADGHFQQYEGWLMPI